MWYVCMSWVLCVLDVPNAEIVWKIQKHFHEDPKPHYHVYSMQGLIIGPLVQCVVTISRLVVLAELAPFSSSHEPLLSHKRLKPRD
ncbi:hypothetical protein F4818DRAFT_400971 [Hypoxylon cercidicola]|nr:hypothetical protein F4818DRAFT_400971 [Hypoxylon cercidicola]